MRAKNGCGQIELGSALQLFEYSDQQGRIAFLQEERDPCLGKLDFPKTFLDSAPEPVAFFSFGQIEIGRQLGKALEVIASRFL